jgi:hypothetical protein
MTGEDMVNWALFVPTCIVLAGLLIVMVRLGYKDWRDL